MQQNHAHFSVRLTVGGLPMSQEDWAKKYAAMDSKVTQKYDQLPSGEQIGKRPEAGKPNSIKS